MEKGKILVLKGKKKGTEINVCFNPPEYTLSKSNEFANINIPGLASPLLQFTRGGLQTLTLELFFDSYETGEDVRKKYTDHVVALMDIDEDLHAPPICRFMWGKGVSFTCVVAQINKKFTMFDADGVPVRATLTVTLNEYATGADLKIPTSSPDRTRVRVLKRGDGLWAVSDEAYGSPAHWRAIAEANAIDDPRYPPVGSAIKIPALEDLDA